MACIGVTQSWYGILEPDIAARRVLGQSACMSKTGYPKKMSWHSRFVRSLPITSAKSILKSRIQQPLRSEEGRALKSKAEPYQVMLLANAGFQSCHQFQPM